MTRTKCQRGHTRIKGQPCKACKRLISKAHYDRNKKPKVTLEERKMKLTQKNLRILREQMRTPEGCEATARCMKLKDYQKELKECAKAEQHMRQIDRVIARLTPEERAEREIKVANERTPLIIASPEWFAAMGLAKATEVISWFGE